MFFRAARRTAAHPTYLSGFNPNALVFRRAPRSFRGIVSGILICLLLAGAFVIGGASPAEPTAVILSTKSAPPPAGFHGVCKRYRWACAVTAAQTRPMDMDETLALASRVNFRVNSQVREISDQQQYRRLEHWSLPTARGGDCEDFALLKKRELNRRGIAPDRLLIATALTPRREAHAVLIVRTAGGDFVLDNRTSKIKPWFATGYSFLRMQDPAAPKRWRMILAGGMFGLPRTTPDT